jgi:hypothetical protein
MISEDIQNIRTKEEGVINIRDTFFPDQQHETQTQDVPDEHAIRMKQDMIDRP